ncbi:MAG: adenine phosphoribosyltransferase [Candidatus Thermoplasmatota archaeon]|nr:adenine phosphoribosyltransferase [Candidatus Thermoplasmatota archaeon]
MLEKLKRSVKESPVVDMGDYHYFIHPLSDGLPLVEPELLDEVVDKVIEIGDLDCDYILTAQSMGFPLAAALSMKTGIPYKFIRKREYGLDEEVSIQQVTGYSESEMYLNFVEEGDRVFLIDDVLSTGGTLKGIITALQEIDAEIVDVVMIFEKVGVKEELEEELGVEIKSLLKVEMDGPEVNIVE